MCGAPSCTAKPPGRSMATISAASVSESIRCRGKTDRSPLVTSSAIHCDNVPMYLSLNPTVVAERVPWPDLARLAAKVGYPGVDVDIAAAMKQGMAATRSLFAEFKIRPAAVVLPVEFRKDDASFRRDLDKLGEASSFSAAIDCPRM